MLAGVKENLRALNSKRKAHQYHAKSKKSALRILGYVENEKGPLSPKIIKMCDDYAASVFNDVRYAPWLYVYSAVSGEFREGWLPSNYWGYVVVPKIKGVHGRISSLKSMNQIIFRSDLFPDLLSYVNGTFVTNSGKVVIAKQAKDYLFSSDSRVIFKPDNSLQGKGIQIYDAESFDSFWVKDLGNGVFQKFIDQDEGLASFFPHAVSTLRLTTAVDEQGSVHLRNAVLRLGDGKDTHVQSPTQYRVPVSLETGILYDFGYSTQWTEVSHHSHSEKPFSGFRYPKFKEAVKIVTQLHEHIPFIKCVGWDVGVDRSGHVQIMEWNGGQNDIKFAEATQGPCFLGLGWQIGNE